MSKEKEVITITGETKPISKCRKFDNGYYLIGDINVEQSGDCYFIGNKYFRVETGQVLFDCELGVHVLKNENLYHGIIGFKDKDLVFGHFSENHLKNAAIILENSSKYVVMDYSLMEGQKQYRERLSDGKFYHINALEASKFNQVVQPRNEYKTSLSYDSGPVLDEYVKQYDKLEVEISRNVSTYSPLLGDLSFGLEFETTAGFIPDRVLSKTGLIPLRDGSIPGIEYVTVPLSGSKGFQTVVNATKELSARTKYDDSCALHMHIGNVPRTPEFLLAMLKMTCALQDEMYTMFPLYKKYNFGVKNKNYSKPYPTFQLMSQLDSVITPSNIDANFNILYSYLAMGESYYDRDCNLKNVQSHPADRDARAKWNITTRYYLNNMIPLIFGNKQTIEFRIHTATLDINKIAPFMLMNAAIVNFTIKNTKEILENPGFLVNTRHINIISIFMKQVSNSNILNSYLKDTLINVVSGYFQNRKDKVLGNNRNGDIVGNENNIQSPRGIDWNCFKKDEVKSELDLSPYNFIKFDNLKRYELEEAIRANKNKIQHYFNNKIVTKELAVDISNSLNLLYSKRVKTLKALGEW